jgi:hypothetical protein
MVVVAGALAVPIAALNGKRPRLNGCCCVQVWWPFHATNRFFARLAKNRRHGELDLAAATEVYPGWYLGGWYSSELDIEFGTVVDLCCELPERARYREYLCCPNWDGKLGVECVRRSAKLLAKAAKEGGMPILVHCAHGVGRSTCVMVAGLLEAGCVHIPPRYLRRPPRRMRASCTCQGLCLTPCLIVCRIFKTADEAFAHIKKSRPTVKRIGTFDEVLGDWADAKRF